MKILNFAIASIGLLTSTLVVAQDYSPQLSREQMMQSYCGREQSPALASRFSELFDQWPKDRFGAPVPLDPVHHVSLQRQVLIALMFEGVNVATDENKLPMFSMGGGGDSEGNSEIQLRFHTMSGSEVTYVLHKGTHYFPNMNEDQANHYRVSSSSCQPHTVVTPFDPNTLVSHSELNYGAGSISVTGNPVNTRSDDALAPKAAPGNPSLSGGAHI